MKCPVCLQPELVMSDRQGIEIDYCPQCRGVWLDRGELDKIIERSAIQVSTAPPPQRPPSVPQSAPGVQPVYGQGADPKSYDDDDDRGYGDKKRRKGSLGELFDFG